MFLQYHFKEICVPYSSQLALLYTKKDIMNKSKIFRGGMTFLQGKDIQKLLKHDPISIVQQECMRQAILNIVLQIAGSSIAHFPVQSMYGLSFWSLKKCCQYHTRFESIAGVTDQLLLLFVVRMPLEPPHIQDKDEHKIGNFVNRYLELDGVSDPAAFLRALNDKRFQLKPYLAG